MPELAAQRFDESRLALVADLDCGDDKFGQVATDWIRCVEESDSALSDIRNRGTQVWLYYENEGSGLVGFGSVGTTTRKHRRRTQTWAVIPHIGIDVAFRQCPEGAPWNERYSAQIMLHLIQLAKSLSTDDKLLLYVHTENFGARKLYDRLGFTALGQPNPHQYQKMMLSLPSEPATA